MEKRKTATKNNIDNIKDETPQKHPQWAYLKQSRTQDYSLELRPPGNLVPK